MDPALARKRRKEIMQSLREENTTENAKAAADSVVAAAAAVAEAASASGPEEALPPKKRKVTKKDGGAAAKKKTAKKDDTENGNKKTQVRYDPDVPMDKDQLAAWRREARRVRNRESAAASRQRIRDRINELETEVGQWKSRYTQAMERLEHLEQLAASQQKP